MLPADIVTGLALRFGFVPADKKNECRGLINGAADYNALTGRLQSAGLVDGQSAIALWKKLELFERARSVIAYLEQQRCSVPPIVLKKYIDRLSSDDVEIEIVLKEEGIALPWEPEAADAAQGNSNGVMLFEEEILDQDYVLAAPPMLLQAGYPELELPDPPPEEAIRQSAPPVETPQETARPATTSNPLEDDLIRALGVEPPTEKSSGVETQLSIALEGPLREELGHVTAGELPQPPEEPPPQEDAAPPPVEEPETAHLEEEVNRVLEEKPPARKPLPPTPPRPTASLPAMPRTLPKPSLPQADPPKPASPKPPLPPLPQSAPRPTRSVPAVTPGVIKPPLPQAAPPRTTRSIPAMPQAVPPKPGALKPPMPQAPAKTTRSIPAMPQAYPPKPAAPKPPLPQAAPPRPSTSLPAMPHAAPPKPAAPKPALPTAPKPVLPKPILPPPKLPPKK